MPACSVHAAARPPQISHGDALVGVTAAHVVGVSDRASYAFVRRGVPTTFENAFWPVNRPIVAFGGGDYDPMDLALFRLEEGELDEWGISALPTSRLMVKALTGPETAILHGFPRAQMARTYGGGIQPIPMSFATQSAPRDAWTGPYDRERHHLLQYPMTDGAVSSLNGAAPTTQLPDPGGISGSGIWTIALRPDRPFWPSDLVLIGVQYALNQRSQLIVGHTVGALIGAIGSAYPELTPALRSGGVLDGRIMGTSEDRGGADD